MDAQAIRERIRKLLNMTVGRGCTEDEADNALRMASGLAMKLGIDLDSMRGADAPRPKINLKRNVRKMAPYEALCAEIAAMLNGVECQAPNFGKGGFWFVGREENISLAEEMMLWLIRQIDLLYKEALPKGLSKRDRTNFRGSFKDACAARVKMRAQRMVWDLQNSENVAHAATGSSALVVRGHFDTLKREIKQYWDERFGLTPEKRAEADRRWREEEERVQRWRKENPEAAAELDKQREREAKREARRAARRKGTIRTRSLRHGSGSAQGHHAGDRVKLRKEIEE